MQLNFQSKDNLLSIITGRPNTARYRHSYRSAIQCSISAPTSFHLVAAFMIRIRCSVCFSPNYQNEIMTSQWSYNTPHIFVEDTYHTTTTPTMVMTVADNWTQLENNNPRSVHTPVGQCSVSVTSKPRLFLVSCKHTDWCAQLTMVITLSNKNQNTNFNRFPSTSAN